MEYRKERNLLIATDSKGNCKGMYDWENAKFYGVKGTQIKRMPAAFDGSTYSSIITSHQWIINHTTDETLTRALRRWECMASLGIYCSNHDVFTREEEIPALKKDLVSFIKEQGHSEFSDSLYKRYYYSSTVPEYNLLNETFLTLINSIISDSYYLTVHFPIEWGIKAMFRLQCEDALYLLSSANLMNLINTYYQQCKIMQTECAITKNFIITIGHTAHIYENYEKANFSNMIKRFNDIPQLYYENENFIVRPLCSHSDFAKEANAQHNCVERIYMEYVAKGATHVVTIRKKSAPDTPFITCEISNNGKIKQYLKAYNNHPQDAESKQFAIELQNHLSSLSWNRD